MRLVQDANRDTKLRAFPWLSPALERCSVDHGNGHGGSISLGRESGARKGEGESGPELAVPREEAEDGEARDVVVERGLCRLVQAATSAAKGEGGGARR